MSKFTKKEDIKTFEDACEYLGNLALITNLDTIPETYRNAMFAHYKLCIIAEAINKIENDGQHWTPDWTKSREYKYYPWFIMGSPSGVGFSFDANVSGRRIRVAARAFVLFQGRLPYTQENSLRISTKNTS